MKRRGLEEEEKPGLTRRSFLRGAVAAGAVGFVGAGTFATVVSLVKPPDCPPDVGDLLDSFLYVKPEGSLLRVWYEEAGLVGEEARITDFVPGRGANVIWKAWRTPDTELVCGFSAMLIMMDPTELSFPAGFPQEDFVIDGLYAIWLCCTHACCRPGWQLIPRANYKVDLGRDNIYCVCHDSQYNPRIISPYQHPPPPDASGAQYFGVHKEVGVGPAPRGMPLIPLTLEGTKIVGVASDLQPWYQYLDAKNKEVPPP